MNTYKKDEIQKKVEAIYTYRLLVCNILFGPRISPSNPYGYKNIQEQLNFTIDEFEKYKKQVERP